MFQLGPPGWSTFCCFMVSDSHFSPPYPSLMFKLKFHQKSLMHLLTCVPWFATTLTSNHVTCFTHWSSTRTETCVARVNSPKSRRTINCLKLHVVVVFIVGGVGGVVGVTDGLTPTTFAHLICIGNITPKAIQSRAWSRYRNVKHELWLVEEVMTRVQNGIFWCS